MPIRHEADFRRKPIRNWDEWVDEEIQKSQTRGEFDDLPDHGKPIKLEDTPFAPEMGFALRTLKNAGYEPTWMELDRKITQGRQDLDDFLRRSAAYLQRLAAESASPTSRAQQPAPDSGWWRRFLHWITLADSTGSTEEPPITPVDLVQFRAQMRAQYLERAAAVDKLITEFHAALPRNLWHLERMRIMPDAAARAFDEGCPPVVGADPALRPEEPVAGCMAQNCDGEP